MTAPDTEVPMVEFSEWFGAFLLDHHTRHPGMPDPASKEGLVFYAGWAENFRRAAITEEAAIEASVRLMAEPAPPKGRHLAKLLEFALAAMGRGGEAVGVPADPKPNGNAAWYAAAAETWRRTSEIEREFWRDRVREGLPELARSPWWLEGLATAWCYDPALVVARREEWVTPPASPFRRVLASAAPGDGPPGDPPSSSERSP